MTMMMMTIILGRHYFPLSEYLAFQNVPLHDDIFTGLPTHCPQLRLPPSVTTLLQNFKMATPWKGYYISPTKGSHPSVHFLIRIPGFTQPCRLGQPHNKKYRQYQLTPKMRKFQLFLGAYSCNPKYFDQLAKIVSKKECTTFKTPKHIANLITSLTNLYVNAVSL